MLATVFIQLFFSTALRLVHRACLKLEVNEEVEFEVTFSSNKPLRVDDKISVQVKGSLYSNTTIQVTGEAYQHAKCRS